MSMNKTKKLTQGAMLLAIIGALIGIDRMSAYWFTELLVLMMPTVIIMYCTMYTLKDGVVLSVGLLIISLLLGNFQFIYLIYVPVGIVTGLAYAYGIKKNLDRTRLLLIAIFTYVIGEIIASFIIYPLLGFPISTVLAEFKETFTQTNGMFQMDLSQAFTNIGLDFSKVLVIIYIVSVILMGIMEGVLIHILSVFILKRFKIIDLGRINLFDIKPNPYVAYLAALAIFGLFFISRIENETMYYVIFSIAIVGMLVLFYYGYLFVVLYGALVLKRNISVFILLIAFFAPALLSIVLIIGFLYGTGPLRFYLESKVQK